MAPNSLRERMLIALRIRNMSPRTERIYIDLVARFALHFHRSPDSPRASRDRAVPVLPPRTWLGHGQIVGGSCDRWEAVTRSRTYLMGKEE